MTWDALYQSLIAAVMLGAERVPLPDLTGSDLPEALRAALDRIDKSDPAHSLMDIAALVTSYDRAGFVPVRDLKALPPDAPDDERSEADPRAGELLRRMDFPAQTNHALLIEWLRLAYRNNQSIPARILPLMLSSGQKDSELRPWIAATMGERGRWLAAQNPDWAKIAQTAIPEGKSLEDMPNLEAEQTARAEFGPVLDPDRDLKAISAVEKPWSLAFAQAVTDRIQMLIEAQRGRRTTGLQPAHLTEFVLRIPVALCDAWQSLLSDLAAEGRLTQGNLDRLVAILNFRREMYSIFGAQGDS